jgi:hypothetical protein
MKAVTKAAVMVVGALLLASSSVAEAQPRRGGRVVIGGGFGYVRGPFYYGLDPFWGQYPYLYKAYPYGAGDESNLRVEVTPRQAEVYVDGYYAGKVDDFDGVFQRLNVTPGGHAITLHFDGYRTLTESVYVAPGTTFKLRDTMEKLAAGETSEQPPLPAHPLAPSSHRPAGRSSSRG